MIWQNNYNQRSEQHSVGIHCLLFLWKHILLHGISLLCSFKFCASCLSINLYFICPCSGIPGSKDFQISAAQCIRQTPEKHKMLLPRESWQWSCCSFCSSLGFPQERGTPPVHIQTHFVELNLIHTPRTLSEQSFGSKARSHAWAPPVKAGDIPVTSHSPQALLKGCSPRAGLAEPSETLGEQQHRQPPPSPACAHCYSISSSVCSGKSN